MSTVLLHPVIPRATARVAADIGIPLAAGSAADAGRWDVLVPGRQVAVGDILFPRLDRDAVVAALLGDQSPTG